MLYACLTVWTCSSGRISNLCLSIWIDVMVSKKHCLTAKISSHLLSWKCQEWTTWEWCINFGPLQQQQLRYGVSFDKMQISSRHDPVLIVPGNNGCQCSNGWTLQVIAHATHVCVYVLCAETKANTCVHVCSHEELWGYVYPKNQTNT